VGVANSACLAFPALDPNLVAKAMQGDPLPDQLVSLPVAPVSQQGTFFIEDFFKSAIAGH
jgi:hypothetical protein